MKKKTIFRRWYTWVIIILVILVTLLLIRIPTVSNTTLPIDNSICDSGKIVDITPLTIKEYYEHSCKREIITNSQILNLFEKDFIENAKVSMYNEGDSICIFHDTNFIVSQVNNLYSSKSLYIFDLDNKQIIFQVFSFPLVQQNRDSANIQYPYCENQLNVAINEGDLTKIDSSFEQSFYKITERGQDISAGMLKDFIVTCNNNNWYIMHPGIYEEFKNFQSCVIEEKPTKTIQSDTKIPNNECYIPILDTSQDNIGTCTKILTTDSCKYITQDECEKELSKSLFARIFEKLIEILDKIFNWRV